MLWMPCQIIEVLDNRGPDNHSVTDNEKIQCCRCIHYTGQSTCTLICNRGFACIFSPWWWQPVSLPSNMAAITMVLLWHDITCKTSITCTSFWLWTSMWLCLTREVQVGKDPLVLIEVLRISPSPWKDKRRTFHWILISLRLLYLYLQAIFRN